MAQTRAHSPLTLRILHWIVYLMLGSTTMVVMINSYDSGVAKPALLLSSASLLAAVFLAQGIWGGKFGLRKSRADVPVLVFLCLIIASAIYTKYDWNAHQALEVWIPFIICFFAGTQLFAAQRDFDKLMWAIATIASIVCIVGLIQFFFVDELVVDFFTGTDRRVMSTLTNATYLSGYIVLLFPTLLAFTVTDERTTRERWILGALLACLVFLLAVTSTRSSLAAFVVSGALFAFTSKSLKKKTLMLAAIGVLVAVVAALYLSPVMLGRLEAAFRNDALSTVARRVYFWKGGLDAVKAAPIFGHGIGSYETAIVDYRSPEYWIVKSEDIVPHAHNELIETGVDLGGLGVVVYLTIIAAVLIAGLKARSNDSPQDQLLKVGLSCSLVAILVDNLANMSLRVVPVGASAWLFMGILASQPFRKETQSVISLRLPKAIAVLPLIAWTVFAFRYGNQQMKIYKADGHIIRGLLTGQAKNFVSSAAEYQLAVSLNPHSLVAHSNLILTLLTMGRPNEALEISTQLQTLSPHYPKSSLMQAAALVSLHRYTEALKKIDTELTLRTHPDAYYYQFIANNGLADTAGELWSLERLLLASIKGQIPYQLGPVSTHVRALVQKEDDVKRFKDIYEQLHSLFPQDAAVSTTLADLSSRLGEPAKSVKPPQSLPHEPDQK